MRFFYLMCILSISFSSMAQEEKIFDSLYTQREKEYKQFNTYFNNWDSKIFKNPKLQSSSLLYVYFIGEDYINLVNMQALGVPFMIEKLMQTQYGNSFYDDALSKMIRGGWRNVAGMTYDEIRPGRALPTPEIQGKIIHFWKNVSTYSREAFVVRRQAFDQRLAQGAIDKEKLFSEPTFSALKTMGLLAVPSIMQRIQEENSDYYDLVLLTMALTPVEGEEEEIRRLKSRFKKGTSPNAEGNHETRYYCPGCFEEEGEYDDGIRLVPKPILNVVPDNVHDTAYWLTWWEENKKDYWWLLPKE